FSRDWSSDVCSSDLAYLRVGPPPTMATFLMRRGFAPPFSVTLPSIGSMTPSTSFASSVGLPRRRPPLRHSVRTIVDGVFVHRPLLVVHAGYDDGAAW